MIIKKNIVDDYYKYIEDKYCSKTLDELLGKKYVIKDEFGAGDFFRIKIEDGLEISGLNISKMEMDFDNRLNYEEILEVGYCYSGYIKILSLPDHKEYTFKKGDIFIYRTLNRLDYFKFKYKNCKTISIHINFNIIKNAINSIWEDKLITDWQENINNIFNGNILIIEKASYDLRKIAQEIDAITNHNVMGYMKIKLKTIEFLDTFLEEKSKENLKKLKNNEVEMITKAKEIINENIENAPSVKELASKLNMSVYKLQKWFKELTGDTVYEYIKKVKIEKAKYLLKNTNMSILEITNEIGYENPSKFANVFKRYNNITPLKYRKSK
ncbi:MAG: AraC family transcriptional regulator [Anaeromicrobium sp.]|jgi:AraC-like DNA-binding protein|uniref:helix-turn-helix domain-containing protein n=1 Tax=Anaeromicrobium sp. TaxID=1929132 RepID=UPI0025D3890C|nr:AraC family transcriptional regulator [Anaeromicrobium sp.]MCT4596139.1 AraC family transcriptional regulator [Anaeromicrobium sp.]